MGSEARGRDSGRMLAIVLCLVVAGFVSAAIITQRMSGDVEELSSRIIHNSTEGIDRLTTLRGSVLEVELALSKYLQAEPSARAALVTAIYVARDNLRREADGYLDLPVLPGEEPHWRALGEALGRFDEAVTRTIDLVAAGDDVAARRTFTRNVDSAARRLNDAAVRGIAFNAQHSRSLAAQIAETRRRTVWISNVLTAACVVMTVLGALLIRRQNLARRALVEAHTRALEARADELELFAGRVAHDIRNPLSTATMAADLLGQRVEDGANRQLLQRLRSSLSRTAAIVTGLLDFALAGAQPDPGARTDVKEVVADLLTGLRPDAERARIEVEAEPVPPVLVACSNGVYLSLLGNLVRNAMKYMGESAVRRITIRVTDEATFVRTSVIDTGPGIPREVHPSIFDAYFRGPSAGREGLGLGLATVKKLAEGHGGAVGFSSVPGEGSSFWFLLRRAGSTSASQSHGSPPETVLHN